MENCDKVVESWLTENNHLSDDIKKHLEYCINVRKPEPLNVTQLMEKSKKFPIKFPITSCRIKAQPETRHDKIEHQAASVYPVIHEKVLYLFLNFLIYKKNEGTPIEQEFYKSMNVTDLIDRIFLKRCAAFVGPFDKYMTISGKEGLNHFEEVGKTLPMDDRLSYDEMKLSALMPVSSYTEFINKGDRRNSGYTEQDKTKIETDGVIIGMIGGRFHRREVMEFQDIIITDKQNTSMNGYGKTFFSGLLSGPNTKYNFRQIWCNFYNEKDTLWSNLLKNESRYTEINYTGLLDNHIQAKRYAVSFETLLLDAQARAKDAQKRGYIHVVGFGLGVWKICQIQSDIFLQAFEACLKGVIAKLPNIAHIDFSWFDRDESGDLKNGNVIKCDEHPEGGIKIFMSKRNPAEKLVGDEFKNSMVIATYAWDSNSLPGNEFWWGSIASSSDPAAACSTLITELHNAHINPMLAGNNLHVASREYGVLHVADFAMNVLNL